jgi:hypothetical protein
VHGQEVLYRLDLDNDRVVDKQVQA